MIITYFGKQFFKVQQGDLIIALNPMSKDTAFKGAVSRFGADIVISSVNHKDYNGIETVTYGDRAPFVISGPGDYEVKDISVKGILTKTSIDKKDYINTVYSITIDAMTISFLGATSELTPEAREAVTGADILFAPVGEPYLDPAKAYKLAVSLEPSIVIPMDYGDEHSPALKQFLKEGGEEKIIPQEKLTLKKKDLEGREGDIMVLSYEK